MTTAILVLLTLYVSANAIAPVYLADKDGIQDSYIVVFADNTQADLLSSDLAYFKTYQNVTFAHTYKFVLKGFSGKLDKDQLMAARNHPRVKYVEQNQRVSLDGVTEESQTCSQKFTGVPSWGLTRVSERDGTVEDGSFSSRYTNLGSGVTIYVIDTGIFIGHNDFEGRATFGFKSDPTWSSTDRNGHGTHVASTTCGASYGLAKHAHVVAVKVLGDDGSGTTDGVIAGVEWAALTARTNGETAVGNMSLGGGRSAALNAACTAASTTSLPMVVAAGNSNLNACSYSPAGAASVITVASSAQGSNNADIRSSFSNYGPCCTMVAPGSSITGAWYTSPTAENTISGTSMASPHVCGAVALLLGNNPALKGDVAAINATLIASSTKGAVSMGCTGVCGNTPNRLLYVGCAQ